MTDFPTHPDLIENDGPPPVDPERENGALIAILIVGVVAVLLALYGRGAVYRDFPALEGYSGLTQTWSSEYQWTTCAEYVEQMTDQQRQVASADLLQIAWKRLESAIEPVPSATASAFTKTISDACQQVATHTGWEVSGVGLIDAFSVAYYNHPTKP
jgi:hypothetical protein